MFRKLKAQWRKVNIIRIAVGIWLKFKRKWLQSWVAAQCEFQAEWGKRIEGDWFISIEWRDIEIEEWEYIEWIIDK